MQKSVTQFGKSSYLNLLKKTLVDYFKVNTFEYHPLNNIKVNWKTVFLLPFNKLLQWRNFEICKRRLVEKDRRINGYDWPAFAYTMIGLGRLNNIESCVLSIIENDIDGDFIETGVWRGGATIFMKAILNEFGIKNKKVWLADSFEGLPKPNSKRYPSDRGNTLYKYKYLKVPVSEVKSNFEKFELLDEQVVFLKGWFKDTLPNAPIKKLALLRLDGDLYESTVIALEVLYPKLSIGGFVIIDDYNAFINCKKAVDDYRFKYGISEEIICIDKEAVYWQKVV